MSQPMQFVAAVGVDAAEHAVAAGVGQFVEHRVPGERGVVRLDVELEVLVEPVASEERDARGAVEVVLVRGRLLRLRLDEELAGEADLLLVVDGHVQELREVVELAASGRCCRGCGSPRGRPRRRSSRRRVPSSLPAPSSPGPRRRRTRRRCNWCWPRARTACC